MPDSVKKLYRESSIKKVSEVIREISGINDRLSHLEQPDAIRALSSIKNPSFTVGPAAGGIHDYTENVASDQVIPTWAPGETGDVTQSTGPLFSNVMYNLFKSEKNLNIIFSVKEYGSFFMWTIFVQPYIFTYAGNNIVKIYDTSYNPKQIASTFTYQPNDKCKIFIDTYNLKLYVYVNDVQVAELTIPDENTKYGNYYHEYDAMYNNTYWGNSVRFDPIFPSMQLNVHQTGSATNGRGCTINYFRIMLEDWDNA